MNEFKEMIKEAFLGEEPYKRSPKREVLEASMRQLERRDRTLRALMWVSVAAMTVLAAWAGWSFWHAEREAAAKEVILYATIFLFAAQAIGWGKMFLFSTQKDLSVLKELKRVQLLLLENGRDH